VDLKLINEKNSAVACVFETTLLQEETMEMIVPDSRPDILKVISSDAKIMLSGKDTDVGRASVRGVAEVDALCLGDDGHTPVPLHMTIPFTASVTSEDLSSDTKTVAECSTALCEVTMINPRKIFAKIEILTSLRCYRQYEYEYVSTAEPVKGVFLKTETLNENICVSVFEKTFLVGDEIDKAPGALIKCRASIESSSVAAIGSRAVIRGNMRITSFWENEGTVTRQEKIKEFSQVIEPDTNAEQCTYDCVIIPTAEYVIDSEDENRLSFEAHFAAQMICYTQRRIDFLADAYSVRGSLALDTRDLSVSVEGGCNETQIASEWYISESTNVSPAGMDTVFCGRVFSAREGETLSQKCRVCISVPYYDENGNLAVCEGKYMLTLPEQFESDPSLYRVVCKKHTLTTDSAGLKAHCDFGVIAREDIKTAIRYISKAELTEDDLANPEDRPALYLHRKQETDALWTLAKSYRSSEADIISANEFEEFDDIPIGKMMLIPCGKD